MQLPIFSPRYGYLQSSFAYCISLFLLLLISINSQQLLKLLPGKSSQVFQVQLKEGKRISSTSIVSSLPKYEEEFCLRSIESALLSLPGFNL